MIKTEEIPRCLIGYVCIERYCEYSKTCQIFNRVKRIAFLRTWCWNYGKSKGYDRRIHGKARKKDIRYLYLTALKTGSICPDCGKVMVAGGDGPDSISIDHIIPRSQGGTNDLKNLRVCCFKCNQEKSKNEMRFKNEVVTRGN